MLPVLPTRLNPLYDVESLSRPAKLTLYKFVAASIRAAVPQQVVGEVANGYMMSKLIDTNDPAELFAYDGKMADEPVIETPLMAPPLTSDR